MDSGGMTATVVVGDVVDVGLLRLETSGTGNIFFTLKSIIFKHNLKE